MLAMATYGCNNDETDMDPTSGDGNGNVNIENQYDNISLDEVLANVLCPNEIYDDPYLNIYNAFSIIGKWKLMLSYDGELESGKLIDHSCDDIIIEFKKNNDDFFVDSCGCGLEDVLPDILDCTITEGILVVYDDYGLLDKGTYPYYYNQPLAGPTALPGPPPYGIIVNNNIQMLCSPVEFRRILFLSSNTEHFYDPDKPPTPLVDGYVFIRIE